MRRDERDEQDRDGRLPRDTAGDATERGPPQSTTAVGGHRHYLIV